jgi:hypothetical protein
MGFYFKYIRVRRTPPGNDQVLLIRQIEAYLKCLRDIVFHIAQPFVRVALQFIVARF